MTYGAECWAVRKEDESIFHVAEMRMLRWIRSKTRTDHVRNQIIQTGSSMPNVNIPETETIYLVGHTCIRSREEDNLSRKRWTWSYRGREEAGGGLDGDGSTTTGKI